MDAIPDLNEILKTMAPVLNEGEYVFCQLDTMEAIGLNDVLFLFRETEGITVITTKAYADEKQLAYQYVAAWITLKVFSSLEATGLTATFSTALFNNDIICNVVAAYNHDHIFVPAKDKEKALKTLQEVSALARI